MNELLYSPKIKPEHLVRKAIVYLRQSSEKQVRQNIESQRLQYELAERVRSLGIRPAKRQFYSRTEKMRRIGNIWARVAVWPVEGNSKLYPHEDARGNRVVDCVVG